MEYPEKEHIELGYGHNPMWCRGNNDGFACGDDPCWECINWGFDKLNVLDESGVDIWTELEGEPVVDKWPGLIKLQKEADEKRDKKFVEFTKDVLIVILLGSIVGLAVALWIGLTY